MLCSNSIAQNNLISGVVLDSASHAPLQNVSIIEKDKHKGTVSNVEGKFKISVDSGIKQLIFTAAGYQPYYLSIADSSSLEYVVMLSKSFTTLAQVVVKGRKGRYRNKGNPAVELIRKVIANKSLNGPKASDYVSYQQYEKARVMLDKPSKLIMNNFVMKKFKFVFENIDTTLAPGKKFVPVYMEEMLSQNYFRKQPEKKKKIITARKITDLGEYLDMKAISNVLNRLYEDVNIYDNSVSAFTMQFLSPLAEAAPAFYMYFIQDTVEEKGEKFVELNFSPRNPEDLLFKGTFYITLDGSYAVKRTTLEISKHINLNYIRHFEINLEFEKGGDAHYHLSHSDMTAFLSALPKTAAMYGQRIVDIKNLSDTVISDAVLSGKQIDTLAHASVQTDSLWVSERPSPLSNQELKAYKNTDSLVKMRSYIRTMDIITLISAGYKSAGKFEIGPVGNFYSFNPIEGSRLQFGMRSKPKLSTRYFVDSYVGYGFGDERWKYSVTGTYSINNKSIYSFPFHYIQASYIHDIRILGQEGLFTQGNSFLGSFNRGLNNSWLYNNIFRLSYVHEMQSHFSYTLGMKYWLQQPTGSLSYIYKQNPNEPDTIKQLTTGELSLSLRWAPHEQFYQGKASRLDIINKYPIFSLQYSKGMQGLFGGQYNYDAFRLGIFKRFYLSPIGFSDVNIIAGYLGGNLPYPLLTIHPGNQSYFYSYIAYNLMNTGEFLSDHYAGMNIDHYFNGFFFNKIPLIKKLRLREVIECKLLFGGLRNENNPAFNTSQMQFPTTNGITSSYVLGSQPYFEAGVGIYNIFSIIRIDLVKRFTYLNHPNISSLGLRFSTNFNF